MSAMPAYLTTISEPCRDVVSVISGSDVGEKISSRPTIPPSICPCWLPTAALSLGCQSWRIDAANRSSSLSSWAYIDPPQPTPLSWPFTCCLKC